MAIVWYTLIHCTISNAEVGSINEYVAVDFRIQHMGHLIKIEFIEHCGKAESHYGKNDGDDDGVIYSKKCH